MTFDDSNMMEDDLAASNRDDHSRRMATVRGLLAKAEATEFAEEAEAFFNKASELIARWAIDEAMLWDGANESRREQPDELRLQIHSPYIAQKSMLVAGVARANGCRAVRLSSGRGAKVEAISVVGFPTDLRWVETLVTSLLVQLTSTMLAGAPSGLTSSESASWRRSYISGFTETVVARLKADRAAQADERDHETGSERDAEQSSSVALVLASRDREVESEYRSRYPHLRSTWVSRGSSGSGRLAGARAGQNALLHRGSLGSQGVLGR